MNLSYIRSSTSDELSSMNSLQKELFLEEHYESNFPIFSSDITDYLRHFSYGSNFSNKVNLEINRIGFDSSKTVDLVMFPHRDRSLLGLETSFLSESALKKDWLRPEEDEAWQDL